MNPRCPAMATSGIFVYSVIPHFRIVKIAESELISG